MTAITYHSVESIDEVNELTEMMMRALQAQPFHARIKKERVKALMLRLYHREPLYRHLLAKIDGKLAGYFIWTVQEDFLTGGILHRELSAYVAPEYRGINGGRIMQHFLDAAAEGADKLAGTIPDDQVSAMERQGYIKYGNAMMRDKEA